MYICSNSQSQEECDTRRRAGLNSEFSFSQFSCSTVAKEPRMPDYLPVDEGEFMDSCLFQGIWMQWNANNFVQNLNSARRVHFTKTITVTLHPTRVHQVKNLRSCFILATKILLVFCYSRNVKWKCHLVM